MNYKHKTILIVDDNDSNLLSLKALLFDSNLNIITAQSAKEALDLLDSTNVDLILSDVQMPQIDGFGFLKLLRARPKTKNIPVIFITAAYKEERFENLGYELGAIRYLTKPIEQKSLFLAIESIMSAIENVEQKEARFKEALLNSSLELKFICNKNLEVIYINKNALEFFGDIVGTKIPDFISCSTQIQFQIEYNKNYFTGHRQESEEFIIFSLQNVTELIEAKNMIEEKNKQLLAQSKFASMGEMIAMIAHQWRQPLTGIGLCIDNIRMGLLLNDIYDEKINQTAKDASEQIHFLSKTIDDFRNFFKPDKEKNLIDINKVLKKALSFVDNATTQNGIKLEIDLGATENIFAYENELLQVFMNIIKNASDAIMENKIENPTIRIKTRNLPQNQNGVIIEIEDNGGGIPAQIIASIFEPYFSTKGKNGTGLGLYMAKSIIEGHHQGFVNVFNTEKGAIFKIELENDFKNI